MKLTRILAMSLACVMAFAVSACTTTMASVDASVQKQLPAICANAKTAHVTFSLIASTGKIKSKTVAVELAAYNSIEPMCENPSSQTAASVLVTATLAYVQITSALKEAQRVQ